MEQPVFTPLLLAALTVDGGAARCCCPKVASACGKTIRSEQNPAWLRELLPPYADLQINMAPLGVPSRCLSALCTPLAAYPIPDGIPSRRLEQLQHLL